MTVGRGLGGGGADRRTGKLTDRQTDRELWLDLVASQNGNFILTHA